MKILLLEDDYNLGEAIKEILALEGFDVDLVNNAQEAYEKTYNNRYDLYIFDINLPDENGIEVLKSLREANDTTPAIYITALTDLDTMSKAFESGAYEYIKKPFEVEELLIRIRAKFQTLKIGDIEVDILNKEFRKNGEIISIGSIAKEILYLLISNKNRVVSKDRLLELLNTTSETSLRVHINKLKKLGLNIKNIRGEGYILEV